MHSNSVQALLANAFKGPFYRTLLQDSFNG